MSLSVLIESKNRLQPSFHIQLAAEKLQSARCGFGSPVSDVAVFMQQQQQDEVGTF